MAVVAVYQGDVNVNGTISANTNIPSDGSVTDAKVSGTASTPIDADKLEHIREVVCDFGIAATAAPAADVYKIVYRAKGAATVRRFAAILLDTGTTSNVKFDLRKASAGSSSYSTILNATVDFTHSDTDNTAKTGSLLSSTLAAGDVLVAFMDYTSATGVVGPAVFLEVDEAAN